MAKKENKKKKMAEGYKSLLWIVGTIIFLILIFIVSYKFFNALGKVEYEGLVFTKEKFGSGPYIDLYRYTYQFPDGKGGTTSYDFLVRTNPAKNNVPISTQDISFPTGKNVYLSIDESLGMCNQSTITIAALSQFFAANGFTLKSGSANKTLALEANLPYVDCQTDPNAATVVLKSGNETRVYQEGNCYIVEASECRILPATEKFEVQALADAMKRTRIANGK